MVRLLKEKSNFEFEMTCRRIYSFLESKNIPVFVTVDHRLNAEKVKLTLRPEKVIMFGSPLVGTPLIEENPDVGIELPSKVLVYQENDSVFVVHFDYDALGNEYHLLATSEYLRNLRSLVSDLVIYATRL